jgi:hypothetical protein
VEIMTLVGQNACYLKQEAISNRLFCVLLLRYLRKPDANILDERNSRPAGSKGFDDVL